MAKIILKPPFKKSDFKELRAGDEVFISGEILTARDTAHAFLIEAFKNKEKLAFNLKGELIYYVGPSPAPPGQPLGAAGPTTSGRMDFFTPQILEKGILALLGKGPRSKEVKKALLKHQAVYLAALGGVAALLGKCITKAKIIAYPNLGAEAIYKLTVNELPAIVIIDQQGNDWYEIGPRKYRNFKNNILTTKTESKIC